MSTMFSKPACWTRCASLPTGRSTRAVSRRLARVESQSRTLVSRPADGQTSGGIIHAAIEGARPGTAAAATGGVTEAADSRCSAADLQEEMAEQRFSVLASSDEDGGNERTRRLRASERSGSAASEQCTRREPAAGASLRELRASAIARRRSAGGGGTRRSFLRERRRTSPRAERAIKQRDCASSKAQTKRGQKHQ